MRKNDVKIFTGGIILTMAENPSAEAVAVENGVIRCVDSLDNCRRFAAFLSPNYEEIDLKGQCLVPGLIDVHCHMTMRGRSLMWANIEYPTVKSIKDILYALKEHAKTLPEGEPVRGFGFDHRDLRENRYPAASELDEVAIDRPVQIMHVSCHVNVVNTYFLEYLDIKPDTPNPDGGTIGKDENGNPNGQLFDSACDLLAGVNGVKVSNHGPNFHTPDTQNNLQKIIEFGQNEYLANGITTTNDVQVTKQELQSYFVARDSELLKTRVVCAILSNHIDDLKNLGLCSNLGDERLSIGSLKTYIDGAITAGTAYMSSPYADGIEGHGFLFHEVEDFKRIINDVHTFGFQSLTHAQGDSGIEIVLEAIQEAQDNFPRQDTRHRIEHSSYATEEQVKKMADMGVYAIPQPHNIYEHGEALVKAYGKERTKNMIPYGWFRKYGIPPIITSDSPVAHVNTRHGIYSAVTRKTMDGTFIGGEEHKLSIEEALKGYTINAAKAIFKENEIGSIEVGKLADFTVFNSNPMITPEDELIDLLVNETWISGEKVYSKDKEEVVIQ